MNYPTFQFLKIHSDKTTMNTYQYTFDHTPTWELIQERPSWLRGPNHASELAFVFGLKDWYPRDVQPTSAELVLSHQMMDMWTNFAKTGCVYQVYFLIKAYCIYVERYLVLYIVLCSQEPQQWKHEFMEAFKQKQPLSKSRYTIKIRSVSIWTTNGILVERCPRDSACL